MGSTNHPKNSILIIEDEPDLCLLLELILNDEKTTVNHVKSLSAAREFLDKERPNLIVLDNRLPDGLGLDFLPFITSNYPQLRVIMISGKDRSAGDLAIENGAHVFLAKPFTKEKLYNSVQALLN
ncbi:MAG: response regulator [Chitinophagaceae bacterium]|nr:response regulator [Chitinophagaceae bacterium]